MADGRQTRLRLSGMDQAAIAAFLAYAASAVTTPLCLVLLVGEMRLTLAQGGAIEVARGGMILAVLLGSAFVAAHWGKARSLGYGLLALGGGAFLYAAARDYAVVLAAVALMGAGSGLVEALINPLVQEQHPDDAGRYLNLVNAFWSVGVMASVLAGGEWLTRTDAWRALIAATGGLAFGVGGWFLILDRRKGHVPHHAPREVWGHKWDILRHPRFPLFMALMALAGAVEGGLTFWTASFIQLHHQGVARAAGLGTACFAGGMIAGRLAGGWWVAQRHLHRLIILSALAGIGVSLLLPVVETLPALYAVLFAAGLAVACFWPSLQAYAVDRMGCEPTALFILLSCGGIPGFAGAAWLMGWMGDRAGLPAAMVVLPAGFALLAGIALLERRCPRMRRPYRARS